MLAGWISCLRCKRVNSCMEKLVDEQIVILSLDQRKQSANFFLSFIVVPYANTAGEVSGSRHCIDVEV